jgi:hypothetical protein
MGDPANQFTIRDIANNLAKINYHPEAAGAPFTAAQYACELAEILRNESPLFQLRALTANAHEAYGGHVPAVARKAERGIHPPALQSDRRDELETSLQNRVRQALCIPDLRGELNSYFTALCYARWTLDATLARDIGASIHPPREEMDEALQRLSEPLRRKITPMIWIKALERYLRTYTDLAILSGIPVKE